MYWYIINVHLRKTSLSLDVVLLKVQMEISSYLVTRKLLYVLVLVRVRLKKIIKKISVLCRSRFFLSLYRPSLNGIWLKPNAHTHMPIHTMGRNLGCVECLQMIKSIVVGFCSIGVWCYSGWWVWDLRTLAQFEGSKMSPGLFQDFMDGYIKLEDSPH